MDVEAFLYFGTGALGSAVMWFLIGPIMSGKGLQNWIKKASEGDAKKKESLFQLFDLLIIYASEREIKTGKKIKVPSGELDEKDKPIMIEKDEIISPVELLARPISNMMMLKIKSLMGNNAKSLQGDISEAMAKSGGDPNALIPLAIQAASQGNYGPLIALAMQMFKSKKPDTPTW